jgi:hypothetical protein
VKSWRLNVAAADCDGDRTREMGLLVFARTGRKSGMHMGGGSLFLSRGRPFWRPGEPLCPAPVSASPGGKRKVWESKFHGAGGNWVVRGSAALTSARLAGVGILPAPTLRPAGGKRKGGNQNSHGAEATCFACGGACTTGRKGESPSCGGNRPLFWAGGGNSPPRLPREKRRGESRFEVGHASAAEMASCSSRIREQTTAFNSIRAAD